MLARWRKVVTVAGALCFPYAWAQAPAYSDDLSCPRFGVRAQIQEPVIDESGRQQLESWYQRYYQNTLDESLLTDVQEDEIIGYAEDWFADEDEATGDQDMEETIDDNGKCSDPTCPCHDEFDLNGDSTDDAADSESAELPELSVPILNSIIALESSDLPGSVPGPLDSEYSESAPVAFLAGTIELIFDDCDEIAAESDTPDCEESTGNSPVLLEGIMPEDDGSECDTTDIESDRIQEGVRFHMFYPGCDWDAYYPPELRVGQSA